MTKIDILKMGTGMVVRVSMNHIVTGVVSTNVPRKNIFERGLTVAGGMVLASILGEIAKNHVDQKIDSAVDWYNQNVIN